MSRLSLKDLTVHIANQTVCEQFNVDMEIGQCWCILGPNGAGKTTLLHTLAGLRKPLRGEIRLPAGTIDSLSARQRALTIGVLLQQDDDPFPVTAREAVLTGRHPHMTAWQWETSEDLEIAHQALAQVDMQGFEDRQIDMLSGGERRRVAIAALYCQQTPIQLLDEPTSHLDLRHQVMLMKQLSMAARKKDRLIVMVLHDLNLAARYCDHAILLDGTGRIRAGKREEIMQTGILSDAFRQPLVNIPGERGGVWTTA